MIEVEGYKAFRGQMKIIPKNERIKPFIIDGDFLYKPDYKCWYNGGSSYPEDICHIVKDDTLILTEYE